MPPRSKPLVPVAQQAQPQRKRKFFSSKIPSFGVVRPAVSQPRPVATDRVLAALQPDMAAVVAAKNFVKEKMGDDKYEIADKREPKRITRNQAASTTVHPLKRLGRPPRKAPVAKIQPKRLATGTGSGPKKIALRIKTKTTAITRKITLRSHTAEPAPAPPSKPQNAEASSSTAPLPVATASSSSSAGPTITVAPSTSASRHPDNPTKKKDYMTAGLYCQDAEPPLEQVLVTRVLYHRGEPVKRGPGRPRKSATVPMPPVAAPDGEISFPPLPLDHGHVHFFGQERDFALPYNVMWESEIGALDGKKRPPFYQKIRTNHFIERSKFTTDKAMCRCDPEFGCGDNCINRIMSYLCGKDCACGDNCGNKSLSRRKGKATKVQWTGSRGFGLFAAEDIAEGEFVTDYRGEVIKRDTFIERIETEYKRQRNFYALAYDGDEVIDSGMRGNDARFINHGCRPNLEVRKYQIAGDGYDEFEIGMWAMRDIKAGEELFYDYNFEAFTIDVSNENDTRTKCQCGAPNCVGYLGRKAGEKSAKEIGQELDAKAAEDARKGKQSASATASSSTSSAATPVQPVKRGPGRPRKNPLPTPTPEVPVKRGPGRPRKNPLPGTQPQPEPATGSKRALAQPELPVGKRPRGRPPKSRQPEANGTSGTSSANGIMGVIKRGPGRPRKNPAPDSPASEAVSTPMSTSTSSSTSESSVSVYEPPSGGPSIVKLEPGEPVASEVGPKRRGRPPKNLNRPVPYPIKRGPGRPRKIQTLAAAAGSAVSAATSAVAGIVKKRGPGRPRKNPLPEQPAPAQTPVQPQPGASTDVQTAEAAPPAPAVDGQPAANPEPVDEKPRVTPKQVQKAKRNGAPCGWAYVPVGQAPAAEEPAPEGELTGRAARLAARRGF